MAHYVCDLEASSRLAECTLRLLNPPVCLVIANWVCVSVFSLCLFVCGGECDAITVERIAD